MQRRKGLALRHHAVALASLLALKASAQAQTHAQDKPQKHEGKIVCGSFSGDPRKYPAWNDAMEIVIENFSLTASPSRAKGQVMRGVVAPSGAILLAGDGGPPGAAKEWTYEFAGKFNANGTTVLKGELADIHGGKAKRNCAISF